MNGNTPATYEISVNGEMSRSSINAFPGFSGRTDHGVTVLAGCLPDQAALFGVLNQIQSLGLELVALSRKT
jgi:hypothetical protein